MFRKIADTGLGIALSLIAAYMFVVVTGVFNTTVEDRWGRASLVDLFFGGPIFALALTFWLVVPIGAILGALIPALVKNKSAGVAVLYGLILGIIIGVLCAAVGAYMIANVEAVSSSSDNGPPITVQWWPVFWREFVSLGAFTTTYSSLWLTGYAWLRSVWVDPTSHLYA